MKQINQNILNFIFVGIGNLEKKIVWKKKLFKNSQKANQFTESRDSNKEEEKKIFKLARS